MRCGRTSVYASGGVSGQLLYCFVGRNNPGIIVGCYKIIRDNTVRRGISLTWKARQGVQFIFSPRETELLLFAVLLVLLVRSSLPLTVLPA